MNNKNKTSIFIAMIATVSLLMSTPIMAEAASYHTGQTWTTDSSHSGELHDDKIPFAIDTDRLSSNLDLTDGTTIENIYSEIESSIALWDDNTDAKLERYDTQEGDHDNTITSKGLGLGTHGRTTNVFHWVWNGWSTGYDKHFLKTTIEIDDNLKHGTWDHNGQDRTDKERNPKNVVVHELGHSLGVCDTYQSTTYKSYECTGVIDTESVMSNNSLYIDDKDLTSTDESTVNGKY